MLRRIVIIQGHPDPQGGHFGHALADAYARGAAATGHTVQRIGVAQLDFPLLPNLAEWHDGPLPAGLRDARDAIAGADHLVLIFPLWLGTMPALLKAFLEQVLRPGFALIYEGYRFPQKGLAGKSARVVVTIGMPVFWYRWFFRPTGGRGLERSILGFCGIEPVRETLIGMAEVTDGTARKKWLVKVEQLGRKGA